MTGVDNVLPAPAARWAPPPPPPPPPRHQLSGHQLSGITAAEHELEHELEHEVRSLRELFRRRRLSVRTMDRRLRLATGAALASLLGTVLLIALRNVSGGTVSLGRTAGAAVTEVATPLFVATLVLISIGFAYVLTGAVLASRPIALLALLVITFEIGVYTGAFGSIFGFSGFVSLLSDWARWTSRGLLALIWLLAVAVMVIDARSPEHRSLERVTLEHRTLEHRTLERLTPRRLRLTVLVLYAVLFGGYFTVLGIASPKIGGLDLFPQSVGLMMIDIADLAIPFLLIAAVDFGEWGGLLGERLATAAGARRRLLVPLSTVLSVSLIAFGYARMTGSPLWSWERTWISLRTTLLVACALVLAVLIGRAVGAHRRSWPATLNFAGLFAVCGLLVYVLAPVSGVIAGQFRGVTTPVEQVSPSGNFTAAADVIVGRAGTGATAFSLLIPRGWIKQTTPSLTLWINGGLPGAKPGTIVAGVQKVGATSLTALVDAQQFATAVHDPVASAQRHDGPWTVVQARIAGSPALIWLRPNGTGGSYLIEQLVQGVPLARVRPQFEAIARSFRPAGQPAATLPRAEEGPTVDGAQRSFDRLQSVELAIAGGLLVVLLGAVGLFGRRWPARLVGTILLFGAVSLAALLYFGDSIGRIVAGPQTHWPFVGQSGLLVAVGVLSLVALVTFGRHSRRRRHHDATRRRRCAIALIGLQATVWTLQGMSALYGHALSASRIAVWAAIIVLVAIAWDVVMSGESMTNEGSARVPRATRILTFLGYVILVSATVLFYSAQHTTGSGEATEPFFEPESVTRDGLFRIAFPLAVLLCLLRFSHQQRAHRQRSVPLPRTTPPAPLPRIPLPPNAPAPPPAGASASPTR